ncbi:glycosyltransferase family 39 protein [Candidatus Gottesmanbacteria bacterium]|nr:glycosyltransferase family 39 protein [Candidatus Gottesmanbacteria bacterium]
MESIANFIFYSTPIKYLAQSIWRDEGFSFFMAKENIMQIILNSINDFNPPLYYILLHIWMSVFGEIDIALRMMSFIFHVLTTYYVFLLARKIFWEKFAFWVAAFTFFNPMLLYYAFEIRMYSLFALFTIASLYYFLAKRWRAYAIFGTLGMYTHSFFSFIIFSYLVFLFLARQFQRKIILRTILPLLFFLPWVPFLLFQFKESQNTWIFTVDLQLILSSLGNLFINYEGTPGGLWLVTAFLSLIIVILIFYAIRKSRKLGLLFTSLVFTPLFIVLSYSVIKRPIYVNRYMIFVTVGEIMAISLALWSIKLRTTRYGVMLLALGFVLYMNVFAPKKIHNKVDIRSTIAEIREMAKPNDLVYANSALVYFESAFYYPYRDKVYIYNPENAVIPKYIGTSVIDPSRSVANFPESPIRTFLVKEDGSYEVIISLPTSGKAQ